MGAAGAAVAGGALLLAPVDLPGGTPLQSEPEVCLRTGLKFFGDAKAACMSKAALRKWRVAPVLDNRGRAVSLQLAHPTDYARPLEAVSNCQTYRTLTKEGWYAASTREMRREAFFERACGALDYLLKARPMKMSYFAEGALSAGDAEAVAAGKPFGFVGGPPSPSPSEGDVQAETNDAPKGDAQDLTVAEESGSAVRLAGKAAAGVWRLSRGEQSAQIQEIAHADFNDDGFGDVLVYVTLGVSGASARTGLVGLVEKTAADAPARFSQGARP